VNGLSVHPAGIERPSNLKQSTAESATRGTKSGALNADLAAIAEAWPTLPEAIRAGILAMVRAMG
jgi:hypothetical protein